MPDSEDILLEAAQSLEFRDFRVVTARWEQLADADGASQEHARAHAERNARCDFDGAVFRFETAHGVIQGTSIRNVFEGFCQAEFDRDWRWVKDTYGDEALVGRVRSIVVDGAGVIVAAGRKRKLFTGALREVIQALDPVCGWLGCNLRAQIAAIDHLQPRSRGGPTDARNGKIMCDHHNIFKHTADYRVERLDDGTILITRPDGTALRPPDAA